MTVKHCTLYKFIEVAKDWMHGCVMENVPKIKIKLENIWIDLIRSIYAPYNYEYNTIEHEHPNSEFIKADEILDLDGDLAPIQ